MPALFQPLQLSASHNAYLRLALPGVPWYFYNDHCDAYCKNPGTNTSTVTLELSVSPVTGNILLGNVDPMTSGGSKAEERSDTDKAGDLQWKKFEGVTAWHDGVIGTLDEFLKYRDRGPLSAVFRTVKLDGEYALQLPSNDSRESGGSAENVSDEFEIVIKIKSLIGATPRDGTMESCRDNVPEGNGVFRLSLAKNDVDGSGWTVLGTDGIDLRR